MLKMTEFTFSIRDKKLKDWLNIRCTEMSNDNFMNLIETALTIGRLAIENAENNGDNGIKELIMSTIDGTLNSKMTNVDNLISEIRKIGFGNEGSSKKGKSNELLILKKLTSEIKNWEFSRVSDDAMNCDLLAESGEQSIMIELKDYTQPVPSKEIKKFIRDVTAKCPTAGLFLCTNGITGQNCDYFVENRLINGKNTPLLFVANSSPSGWVLAFLLLEELIKQVNNAQSLSTQYDCSTITHAINTFIADVEDSIMRLKSLDGEISRLRSEYAENRRKINDLLDDTYKSIFLLETNMKIELQTIVEDFTKNKLVPKENIYANDCVVMNSKSFNEWVAGNSKADAYVILYNCAKENKCKIGLDKKRNVLVLLSQKTRFPLAHTLEKPASIQLIYNFPIKDGAILHYNYEVSSQSGQVYFNLCKIKNDIGEEILKKIINNLNNLSEEL
jgi:hypothetical protein